MPLVGDRRRDAVDHNAGELTKANKLTRTGTTDEHTNTVSFVPQT
jgi:hypothetical protein